MSYSRKVRRHQSWPAKEHVRELGGFFADMGEIGIGLMDEFIKARKKRKYLKQSLKRFIDKGLVVKRGGKFVVTRKGIPFFDRTAIRRELGNKNQWDGKWRLITFDVPVKLNKERDQLRSLLREFGFYQLQKSVWIYPSHLADKFWKLIVDLDLNRHCKVMLVEFLEEDEKIKQHFRKIIN